MAILCPIAGFRLGGRGRSRFGHQSDGFRISPQPLEALVWRRLGLGRGAAWGSPFFLSRERGVPHVVEKLLDDVLTVESVRIETLAINLASENGRWNIEGLGEF